MCSRVINGGKGDLLKKKIWLCNGNLFENGVRLWSLLLVL